LTLANSNREIFEYLNKKNPKAITFPDLEGAFIGLVLDEDKNRFIAVYSYDKMIKLTMDSMREKFIELYGENEEKLKFEAIEYLEFNTLAFDSSLDNPMIMYN
jgi:hypothetical protein